MDDAVRLSNGSAQGDPHAAEELPPLLYGELSRLVA
jgi:hypothetical protein